MKGQHYEISIVAMDNYCNNSVDYINICTCGTKTEAQKAALKAVKDLKNGYYNSCLKNISYAYVNALPYGEDGDCLLGLAWDYGSEYFERAGEKWQKI